MKSMNTAVKAVLEAIPSNVGSVKDLSLFCVSS
jgi:hypothetical protein